MARIHQYMIAGSEGGWKGGWNSLEETNSAAVEFCVGALHPNAKFGWELSWFHFQPCFQPPITCNDKSSIKLANLKETAWIKLQSLKKFNPKILLGSTK